MAAFDYDVTNHPRPSVDQEVRDLSYCSVACFDAISIQSARAAKMRINSFLLCVRHGLRNHYRVTSQAPQRQRFGIVRVTVVAMIFLFLLAKNGFVLVDGRTLFN